MGVPASSLRDELGSVRRRLAVIEGERRSLESRRDVLVREVGLAKGRLAQKSKVDAFLEELQAEAHLKRVGDFEKLLTALVAEVLPGEYPIGLNLEIDRGQPSLDIVSRRGADLSEDIYDDQGGALTNVVSMGLRMIAAVRSRTRRFLVLDESDCWIKTDRVPSFYKVLKEAAGKVGVQCLAISHHDVSNFEEGISVSRLSGDKDVGVMIENPPRRHRWADEEDGIRFIRLRNFQTFVDETIHLAPGVNALTGRNNLGKSAIVRALRAVFNGESRDALIRHGERSCTVEIGFSEGVTLHWNRQARRNPINVWKLLGSDGAVINDDGMVYESGGRTPPEWVSEIFGIGPVEGLDVHINKQKSPVFLLDKPGSTRAAVLSVGQESGHIRSMIALHRERCARDATKVKDGEREMGVITSRLEALDRVEVVKSRLDEATNILDGIERRSEQTKHVEAAVLRIEEASARSATLQDRLAVLASLPDRTVIESISAQIDVTSRMSAIMETIQSATRSAENSRRLDQVLSGLPEEMPSIIRSDDVIQAGRLIRQAQADIVLVGKRKAILSRLPDAMPDLADCTAIEKAVALIEQRKSAAADVIDEGVELARQTNECEAELASLTEDMGHACPVCGGGIADPHVLLGDHHHHAREDA